MRLKLAAYIASEYWWIDKYDYVEDFYEGFSQVRLNSKWGLVNTKGEEVVPPKYDYVGDFHDGFAAVSLNGEWGIVNTDGKEFIPLKYDVVRDFDNGLAAVKLNGRWGFIDTKGEEFIPLMYNEKECRQLKALVDTGEYEGTKEEQYNQAHEEFQIWKKENKP